MIDGRKVLMTLYTKNHTPEELDAAKEQGYLFDPPAPISHDNTMSQLRALVEEIEPKDVANAFLYSLSTRKLEYRSALGSYWYAKAIPDHSHTEKNHCYLCGWSPLDLCTYWNTYDTFNHSRYTLGGGSHTAANYALFDLCEFQKLAKVTPTDEDWRILYAILDTVTQLEPQQKAGTLRQLLTKKKILKGNKNELSILLDILGICGVLASPDAPCYCDHFTNVYARSPVEHTNDFAYPLNRWYACDGVNINWFHRVFGRIYPRD